MKNKHTIWVEKYRPKTIDEYIFHTPQQRSMIVKMINDRSIPHLLFSGPAGGGKTTLAQILIHELELEENDVLIINASDERGIDTFREKIKNFASSCALGAFKVILLEEADSLTPESQQAMRRFMEEYSNSVRFILTCNYEHKITAPIKSRCQHFQFKASDKNDIAEYLIRILATERIKFDLNLLDKYITFAYPDIRKIINLIQQNSINGVLQEPIINEQIGDYKFKLIDLIERDKWIEIRKLVCSNVVAEEWESIYRFLYENLNRAPKFQNKDKWEEGIVIIADHLAKHPLVADPEINAAAMFIRLGQL